MKSASEDPPASPWDKPGPEKEAWKNRGNRYTADELIKLQEELKVSIPRPKRTVPHHG